MNPLAQELNEVIISANPHVHEMLSEAGKKLFFPKGILSQSAEAKEKAYKFNATIGMATEKGHPMHLTSVTALTSLEPEESLTYAPSFGVMALRKAWKDAILEKNPSLEDSTISLPIVTQAITHGLSILGDMWVDPNDVIILPDKMWGNYNMIFSVRRNANIINYPLFNQNGGFNIKGFRSCIQTEAAKQGKIIVLLNFPNNPTGYTINKDEGKAISDILVDQASKGTNVLTITDDAYFGLFYEDDVLKESIFTNIINRDPRLLGIKLDGATKENYAWGLRIGFITYGAYTNGDHQALYTALEKKTAGAVRGSISNASHLSQSIMYKSFQSPQYKIEKEDKFRIMKSRALEAKRVLSDPKFSSAWEVYPFNSGYFMCLRLKTVDAETLRIHLLDKYGVGCISIGKSDFRIAFSCIEKNDIDELFHTIYRGIKDLES
ncbi:MAG: aminotransferase class I/II-fold pyridoxal phosphate-dependent enzyme [Deltaproteobacteria bacterium]|nr:aminotransferase class I/II-fold pyridoxal phosphate-dependent enzyme [Deltaproteobacteria bacterium]